MINPLITRQQLWFESSVGGIYHFTATTTTTTTATTTADIMTEQPPKYAPETLAQIMRRGSCSVRLNFTKALNK